MQFWRGDPDNGGIKIDGNQTISLLNNGDNITINMSYNVSIGFNNIFVVVDPPTSTNGTIAEVFDQHFTSAVRRSAAN